MDDQQLRNQMVTEQLEARNITDPRVLAALRRVPRHLFVPPDLQHLAYRDGPLPIGRDQTISQPYIVALMTQILAPQPDEVILEIGTGSGYQTAVLAELCQQVYSLERQPDLAEQAGQRLARLGYTNIEVYVGDGSQGLPDMAPFDGIIVTAAAPLIPDPLRAQLREGGRLVLPVGNRESQVLQRARRVGDRWRVERLSPVKFVPLIGRHGFTGQEPDSGAR